MQLLTLPAFTQMGRNACEPVGLVEILSEIRLGFDMIVSINGGGEPLPDSCAEEFKVDSLRR